MKFIKRKTPCDFCGEEKKTATTKYPHPKEYIYSNLICENCCSRIKAYEKAVNNRNVEF